MALERREEKMTGAAEARCGVIVHRAEEGVGLGNVDMGRETIDEVDVILGKEVLSVIGRGSVGKRVSPAAGGKGVITVGRGVSIKKKGGKGMSIPGDGTCGKIPPGRGGGVNRVSVMCGRMGKAVGRTVGIMRGYQMMGVVAAAAAGGINVVVVVARE